MSICGSSISSAFAVGVGSGRDGVVGVDVDGGEGAGVDVDEGELVVGAGEGGGGSCVEQLEMIKAATTRMAVITCFMDIAFSWRDSI